ncbi:hypothetical protein D3C80_1708660 [compost metagenome]
MGGVSGLHGSSGLVPHTVNLHPQQLLGTGWGLVDLLVQLVDTGVLHGSVRVFDELGGSHVLDCVGVILGSHRHFSF